MADYLDNFTDANGTTLGAHTSDSGHKYQATTVLVIDGNELVSIEPGTTGTAHIAVLESDGTTPFVTGTEFDLEIAPIVRSNNDEIAVKFCYSDSGNHYQVAFGGQNVILGRLLAGAYTALGTAPIANSGDTIKVEVRSGTLEVFKNGTSVIGPLSETDHARNGQLVYPEGRGNADPARGYSLNYVSTTNITSSSPTLSSVPATAFPGQSRTVTGTGFGATQGTGGLTIGGVTQTITAWSDTSIAFTTVLGNNKYEAGKTLEVTTDAATTVSDTIELVADTANGFGYVDMSSPNTTDESSVAFNTTPTVVTGDQFEWEDFTPLGNLTVGSQGFVTNVDTEGTFRGRFWDATDSTWGAVEAFTASVPGEEDTWPFGKGIKPAATKNWTWGRRHPKTNMRVRIYK